MRSLIERDNEYFGQPTAAEEAATEQPDPASFAPSADCTYCGARFHLATTRAHHVCPSSDLTAEIERLRAVNVRLIAALRPFAEYFEGDLASIGGGTRITPEFKVQRFIDAKAALKLAEAAAPLATEAL